MIAGNTAIGFENDDGFTLFANDNQIFFVSFCLANVA